jgi:hypothetical protein
MNPTSRILLSCVLVLSAGGCERRKEGGARPPAEAPAATEAPPVPPPPPASGGHGGPHTQAPADSGVTGKILETMDAAGYTYLKLATDRGEVWAAVQQAKVAVGDTVTISDAMEMTDFESPTLGRTFDLILFGTLGSASKIAPTAPAKVDAPVPRAEGASARTVAEVFAQKAALADKPVALRGKVTKFNANIMGKNWLHLQDGTGAPGSSDFDLIVTTAATATVGEVVTVRGVVRIDQDFGAGYAYPVLVEDATLER